MEGAKGGPSRCGVVAVISLVRVANFDSGARLSPTDGPRNMDLRSVLAGVLGAAVLIAGGVGMAAAEPASDPGLVARGHYLAKAADCMPCHTAASGKSFAGGSR